VGGIVKAVLLLSGGFDSPVAGRMLLRQGVELEALHGSFEPVTDDASVRKAKVLAGQLGLKRLWVAKIGEHLGRVPHDAQAHRYYFLLQKRLLYRLADRLADAVGAQAVATGENLAQVSSQTLSNLVTLEQAARRPVVRPLLGLDKTDILRLAKEWGTYETSVGPELCDLLGPKHPATTSDPEAVAAAEGRVGLADLPELACHDL
jgi:thiamine biosynthesis protein ThiI